jgi:hypothetical protein
MSKFKPAALAAVVALGVALLAGCTKTPEPPAASAASPAAAPTASQPQPRPNGAAPTASQASTLGNPDAVKDPVFNMPAQPVLDVSKSKDELDKIAKDALK